MKISIVADLHLNKAVYKGVMDSVFPDLPFRTADFEKSLEYMVDENIEKIKPDLFVIAGDSFDTFDPSNDVRAFFNSQLRKLSEAKIPTIILVGNHDVCKRHHALRPIAKLQLKNIKIVESPQILEFRNKLLLLFPYSMEVEQGKILIRDQFKDFLKQVEGKIEEKPELGKMEKIFFGHFGVKGAIMSKYTEKVDERITTSTTTRAKKNYYNTDEGNIGIDDLDLIGADYVFLGDYHQFQVLPTKKCISIYCGSIEKTDMTEIDQKKGFVVYDDEATPNAPMGRCKFVEYPNCRPMVELKGNIKQIEDAIDKLPSGFKGAIVKISFVGNNNELMDFSLHLEEIKRKIRNNINPIHIFHEQKVIDQEEEKEAAEIECNLVEKGHIDETVVLETIKDMIKEREASEEEQDILIQMSSDIYKEATEAR